MVVIDYIIFLAKPSFRHLFTGIMMKNKRRGLLQQALIFWKATPGFKVTVYCILILLVGAYAVYLIERPTNQGFSNFFDSIWWTIVTISTIGYGDRYPMSTWGRIIAIFIIFCGMGIMAAITGRIATFLMERQMKAENGLLDYANLKGHFIICGWKREMNQVLYQILANNPNLNPPDIVLLNRADKENADALRSDPRLKGTKYVHGDFIEERELLRAGVRGAARIMVLADHLTEGNLQQIDSKTVMAVMSVKNLNKTAYVCAELLDTKFEKYLRLSHCDEILLSRDFIRSMLAFSALGTGVSHVIQALLQGEKGFGILTLPIPPAFIDKPYGELCVYFGKENRTQCIGLLENTGNILTRKQEALHAAQKNPDISQIIPELRGVKTLTANEPVINPAPEYRIKKYCRAIVIQGSTAAASASKEAA
jgi:voltage-gated potassium channel